MMLPRYGSLPPLKVRPSCRLKAAQLSFGSEAGSGKGWRCATIHLLIRFSCTWVVPCHGSKASQIEPGVCPYETHPCCCAMVFIRSSVSAALHLRDFKAEQKHPACRVRTLRSARGCQADEAIRCDLAATCPLRGWDTRVPAQLHTRQLHYDPASCPDPHSQSLTGPL